MLSGGFFPLVDPFGAPTTLGSHQALVFKLSCMQLGFIALQPPDVQDLFSLELAVGVGSSMVVVFEHLQFVTRNVFRKLGVRWSYRRKAYQTRTGRCLARKRQFYANVDKIKVKLLVFANVDTMKVGRGFLLRTFMGVCGTPETVRLDPSRSVWSSRQFDSLLIFCMIVLRPQKSWRTS